MNDPSRHRWFLAGLLLATLATLALEVLDTRLLSVMTWYHLSFFAVSVAMFGMSAGAVHVYLGGERFEGENAPRALGRVATALALVIPISHVANLVIPLTIDPSLTAVAALVFATVALAAPFYLSGILVAVALTRIPGRIGVIYGVDLLGAAAGCLAVIPLLSISNITAAVLIIGALAAGAAVCFHRFAGTPGSRQAIGIGVVLLVLAGVNGTTLHGFRVIYAKEALERTEDVQLETWNTHSQVVVREAERGPPPYWGPGSQAGGVEVTKVTMVIDGSAGTTMTRWSGDPADIDWVRHDVTSLPYHLRQGKRAAIIGVGGGRDILTALWAGSTSVTGVEINDTFVELLNGPLRDFAHIADRPEVSLIHDEARSYLTRSDQRFDVLQMSLIDTWASTGAGAFTLSENGLYTRDAWRVFLGALEPGGIFSVSRWFSPDQASETSRLLSLGTAALLDRGVVDPSQNMALVARNTVATLLVSVDPLTAADLAGLRRAAAEEDFDILLAPGMQAEVPLFARIVGSRSLDELEQNCEDRIYDFSPPTDQRPYFFNMLKPAGVLAGLQSSAGVIVRGNILATVTLLFLGAIAMGLVGGIIGVPLWRSGLPKMERSAFGSAVAYFALIGLGFMMVEIPFIQRFSVYLGHPVYSIAVILFSMILFTGIGSFISDKLPVERKPIWLLVIPVAIAVAIAGVTTSIQPIIDATIKLGLVPRAAITVGLAAPLAILLGFCFPIGMRLVGRIAVDASPWMWGVNGACGVLASVLAVATSMWIGIHASLYLALALYLALVFPARALWKAGEATDQAPR